MTNVDYNLNIVLEGLEVICATPEERKVYFSKPESFVDDNFDFIVLDYLPGAVDAGFIPKDVALDLESLFREADVALSDFSWQEVDDLFASKSPIVRQWQSRAAKYLNQIKAHNKPFKQDF
jgi:hypothetical protein